MQQKNWRHCDSSPITWRATVGKKFVCQRAGTESDKRAGAAAHGGYAKVRQGPPLDDEEDFAWPVWAGVAPIQVRVGPLQPDGRLMAGVKQFDPARLIVSRFGREE